MRLGYYLCYAHASYSFVEVVVLRTRLWTVRTMVPLETDGRLAREGVVLDILEVVFF